MNKSPLLVVPVIISDGLLHDYSHTANRALERWSHVNVRVWGKTLFHCFDTHKSCLRTDEEFVDESSFSTLTSSRILLGKSGGGCTCAWERDLHKTAVSRWQENPESSKHCTYCANFLLWLHPFNIVLSLTWIKPWNKASTAPAAPDHLIHMPWHTSSQPLSLTSQKSHFTCKWKPKVSK